MAIVSEGSIYHGLSGKMGNVVFRQVNGKTIACAAPVRSSRKSGTASQKKNEKAFLKNVAYAKKIMQMPHLKKQYAEAAGSSQTAYNRAFSDAAHPPCVHDIEFFEVTPEGNTIISISAEDDFRVDKVLVSIFSAGQELMEEGNAVIDDWGMRWRYETAIPFPELTGCTIKAVAIDLPGNKGVLIKKI